MLLHATSTYDVYSSILLFISDVASGSQLPTNAPTLIAYPNSHDYCIP